MDVGTGPTWQCATTHNSYWTYTALLTCHVFTNVQTFWVPKLLKVLRLLSPVLDLMSQYHCGIIGQ